MLQYRRAKERSRLKESPGTFKEMKFNPRIMALLNFTPMKTRVERQFTMA
jgi:hypothetical protein